MRKTWAPSRGVASVAGIETTKACLRMRMLERLEIKGGWVDVVKPVPNVQNTLADGVSL